MLEPLIVCDVPLRVTVPERGVNVPELAQLPLEAML